MKIRHISIENYRVLNHFDMDFTDNINVLIGINGSGKSTLLHALRILLSWFTARMQSKSGRGMMLTDEDITKGEDACKLELITDNGIRWRLYKQRSAIRKPPVSKSDLLEMNAHIDKLYEDNRSVQESIWT